MSISGAKNSIQVLLLCFLACFSIYVHVHATAAATPPAISAAQASEEQEVFLSFNYRNLFEKVIIAYYEDGTYYLPVSEIFSSLKVPHQVDAGNLTMNGTYLQPDNRFSLNFNNYSIFLDSKGDFQYDASQMRVRELDFYIPLEIFAEVFDLNFTVDLNNLLLQLQTPNVLPIVEEQQRAERRRKQELLTVKRDYHPLEYDRDRAILGGGFFDYSLTANLNEDINFYNYNLDLGSEFLGGDLQGSAFGSYSEDFSNFTTSNLRWRYVLRDNRKLSQIYAGQTNSDGLISRNFTGIRLTNEPIEPRFLYDSFEIEGRAQAGSEVELYYNNALYDYKRVTDNGQYRFLAPLIYGTSRLRLRIFGPDGSITEREERIQIPFSFLPEGEFSYHLNAGRLDNTIFGSGRRGNIIQGDVAYGISNWLTQKAGVEYFNEFTGQSPQIYSSTSARLLDDYLLNLDVAPGAFYRISSNVVYPSSASWGLNYTYYSGTGIYNPVGIDQVVSGNVFVPFRVSEIPFNIRLIGNYSIREPVDNTSYTLDLNARINRLNLRLSYRDRQFGQFRLQPGNSSTLSASGTYLISRDPEIPRYLQNTFISARLDYNPGLGSFDQAELQASRGIFEKGRIQASFSRNFIGEFNYFNFGVIIDFNAFRSTSTVRNSRNQTSFTQNVRGSIGFDDYNNDVVLSNRQQVGQAATSIRLYVDSNNSGGYDEGDETIEEEAVRIGRAGVISTSKAGILRFSQLQAYHRVNMEINEAAIKNPLLIPEMEKFSIVTDPNQYKPINIPFYMSGVIEGRVNRVTPDRKQSASGIRLFLKARNRDFKKELQTFSDGSFYAYEVPPGTYTLEVDSTQLQFLNARTEPKVLEFEVQSVAEGDFVEGLNIDIVPLDPVTEPVTQKKDPGKENASEKPKTNLFYEIQLASYATADFSLQADQRAEALLADSFYVRYNPYTKLFALRSAPINNKKLALKKLRTFSNSPFNELALVMSKDTSLSSKDVIPGYAVVFGMLESRERADEYASQVKRITGYNSEIDYDNSQEVYRVISNTFQSKEKAVDLVNDLYRRSISSDTKFSIIRLGESEIPGLQFRYAIEIVDIDETTAQQYYNVISEGYLPDNAELCLSEFGLLIEGIPSWNQTVDLKRELERRLDQGVPIILLNQFSGSR